MKRLRKIHQYTQEDLAEKFNIYRQSVAKWESGESAHDIDSEEILFPN
ncbi:helix-turn-helix transcriptional regulator [Clostridioides sp. ES-W-0017-02]